MKKHNYIVVLSVLLSFIILVGNKAISQTKDDNTGPDWNNWTEEQVNCWKDSIHHLYYPKLRFDSINASTVDKFKPARTSEPLPAPQSLSNPHVPNSVSIDLNKAVGEIPMSQAVVPSGAVTYNVPVEIYPGIRGFQPQLSLTYNSLAGNGITGIGWSLTGLSSISRIGKNHYFDGAPKRVQVDKNDALTLDGMRLIKISETASQIQYETEQGMIKVNALLNGNVIRYFEVFYPNGRKGIFGYSGNSNTDYLSYPVTFLSDLQGNSITFTYSFINNHYVINKITYGGNASMEFAYTSRQDPIVYYEAGIKIQENQLLQGITCKFGTAVLRSYGLSYQMEKNTSALSQINCTASGSSFNPLRFYYGEGKTAYTYVTKDLQLGKWFSGAVPGQLEFIKGRFVYNSTDEGLIVKENKNPYWNERVKYLETSYEKNMYVNLHTGNEPIFLHDELSNNLMSFPTELVTEEGFIDIFCANLNGQYEDEVVKVNNIVSGTNDRIIFKVYEKNIYYGEMVLKYKREFNLPTVLSDNMDLKSVHPKYYYAGDFNGDGKMEIFAISCHNPLGNTSITSQCYLFDLENNRILYQGYVFPHLVEFLGTKQTNPELVVQNSDRLLVFDYDGDGKSDVCHVNNDGVKMYSFTTSGSSYNLERTAYYGGLTKYMLKNRSLLLGEMNGDGKPDFLLSPPKTNSADFTWKIYYSTGNGDYEMTTCNSVNNFNGLTYFMQDVNRDGLTDLIAALSDCYLTYITRNNLLAPLSEGNTNTPYTDGSSIIPVDINSNCRISSLLTLKDEKIVRFNYPRNDNQEKLLTGAASSLGMVNKQYYQEMTGSRAYTGDYAAVFPYENFQGPLLIPVKVEQFFNGQKNKNCTYEYANAVVHKQGRGFCGFQKFSCRDEVRGINTAKIENDPFNYGVMKSEESPSGKKTYSYSINTQSNKITKIWTVGITAVDYLKNITITSGYSGHDVYGNPGKETVDYGGGISVSATKSYANNSNEQGYLIGLPVDVTTTINRSGSIWTKRSHIPSYSNGLPLVQVQYVNGLQTTYETFKYDSQGNVTEKGIKQFTSPVVLTSSTTYDNFGRVTSETDPLSFTSTYEYNPVNGSLNLKKNNRGQATIFSYDAFGRVASEQYPDGTFSSLTYSWESPVAGGVYCKSEFALGKPTVKTYFDALGRELRSSLLRFNGAMLSNDKLYDSYGRLQKTSLPFTGNSAVHWNTYVYDQYDRQTNLYEASGKATSWSYNGNSITTTKDGIASTRNFDNQGNAVSVTDPAGTISYNLRPDGQPGTIVAPGNIITSFAYDQYGRQTGITDPSAGTQSYTYDDAGNVKSETDANNNIVVYEYDTFGRVKTRTSPELRTTYTYNNVTGLLGRIASNNNSAHTFVHDTLGRVQSEVNLGADGKWLQKIFTYTNGNVQSIQYKSQVGVIATENFYYSYGHLAEIKLNNQTTIWKLNAENTLGQPVDVTTGNFTRKYGYNGYGMPTSRSAGSFQNFSYDFDPNKGNLTYRIDNRYGIREDFGYDNLNRLTGYGGQTAVYDNKGNIIRKTDIGSEFKYATTGKPYAISGVESPAANAIALSNQAVSYNSFKQPVTISEGSYIAAFAYNHTGNRIRMELKKNGVTELKRHYLSDCYELDESVGGTKEKLYLGGDYYTAPAVYVKENGGSGQVYYICRDYLGSITHIANSSGSLVQELSYDAWGRLRNSANQSVYASGSEPTLFLGRGYTGHEHLACFGLINMNARLYDPAVGRFLSPDPYVQAPDFSQNFNRYAYGLNNPLKFVDPDGEFVFIPLLIAFGAGFIGGYASYGIASDNWGMNAVYSGLIGGAVSAIGFYAMGGAMTVGNAFQYAGNSLLNQGLGYITPSFGIPIGDFGISITPGIGFGIGGLTAGMNLSGYYSDGDFSAGAGVGAGGSYWGWNTSATYKGYGGGYGQTSYGRSEVMGQQLGAQRVGTYTAYFNHNSFSISNDLWGDKHDRWRTSAAELTIGKWSVGTYLYTNDGAAASKGADGISRTDDSPNCVPPWPVGKNNNAGLGTWTNGRPYSAPLWAGYRNGNQITRIGLSHPTVHNLTQNWVHKGFGKQNYYMSYDEFRKGGYFYTGYNNPFSLWNY